MSGTISSEVLVASTATVESSTEALTDGAARRQYLGRGKGPDGPSGVVLRGRRGWLMRRALVTADGIALAAAFLISLKEFAGHGSNNDFSDSAELLIFAMTLPIWCLVANLYGLYDSDEERADHSTADDLVGVFHLITIGTFSLLVATEMTGVADPSIQRFFWFWLIAIGLVTIARSFARFFVRRSTAFVQNTVIVGAGEVGQTLARKIEQHPEYGLNIVGFVDSQPKERQRGLGTLHILGAPAELEAIVRLHGIERVIVAFSNERAEDTIELVRSMDELRVQVDIVPRLFEVLPSEVGVHTIEGVPLVSLPPGKLPRSALLLKRGFDIVFALTALVVLSPVLALVAIAIKLDSPGPVFFRQTRMGAGAREFRIFKFRTMYINAEEIKASLAHLSKHADGDDRMFKITDDPRVTRVGNFVRRYSLDELPQLFNVVLGQMSIVGPRPLILDEDRHVIDWRRRRLYLKPGITGLWQVLGRDGIPFDEMVKLDYLYVTNWSVFQDLKLILRTIPVVFRSHAS
jgi:exopolysaccharide biosynthesis polyprenyl glycosylphosphotransferase